MRKGAINYMAAHASTDCYESHVRSGHSFGTSQESYIDQNSLVLSVTAGKALNNYSKSSHFLTPHAPPNFEILGPTQEENMLKNSSMSSTVFQSCYCSSSVVGICDLFCKLLCGSSDYVIGRHDKRYGAWK
jgi:hypothetical protein